MSTGLPHNVFGIDAETECAVAGCADSQCRHALTPHTARVTVVAVWGNSVSRVFRDIAELKRFCENELPADWAVTGHYLTFDIPMLAYHGFSIPLDRYYFDSHLAATVDLEKVPEDFLASYAEERAIRNKALPKGKGHRVAGQYSLKAMAPYFLRVPPFWEATLSHNDDTYVTLDAEYAHRLADQQIERLRAQGQLEFFMERAMRWTRQLLEMTMTGVPIDLGGLTQGQQASAAEAERLKQELDVLWAPAYSAYIEQQRAELAERYGEMKAKAVAKAKNKEKTEARYTALQQAAEAKIEPLSLSSPTQLSWLLRDYFGLDIRDGIDSEDSTGKAVLQRLVQEGRADIKTLLDWRAEEKLLHAFYPTLLELQRDGRIHASFNVGGARTGRGSSSNPNMQQQPPRVRKLFVAPPGMELADFDSKAIEPHILAFYSEDKTLFDLLDSDSDFHGYNALALFGLNCAVNDVKKLYPRERKVAKEVGLSILYGAGAGRLQVIAMKYGYSWSPTECKQRVRAIRAAYPGLWQFKKQLDELAATDVITGYFGKKYRFAKDDIYMTSLNSIAQGSAAQIIFEAACRIAADFKAEGIAGGPLLTVHDAIVTAIPEGSTRAVELITRAMTDFDLPTQHGPVRLKVEGSVGKTWK